jgi:putative MATE family efflux protein
MFMLPMIAGELLQLLYSMADAFIVGRTLGTDALAAVGCTAALQGLIFGFAIHTTNGFAIILTQRFGAGDKEGVQKSFIACMTLCFFFGTIFTVILIIGTRHFLSLMRTPAVIFDDAYRYISIIFCGTIITFFYNMLSNIMRSFGDSRSPLYFLIISSVLNIILDYVLILICRMGVAGAGIATVLSQLLSFILCTIFIIRRFPDIIPRKPFTVVSLGEIRRHLTIGIAMGLQRIYVEMGNIVVQAAMNGLGTVVLAAVVAGQRIRQLNMLPLFCMGSAITFYTAQNYGAGKTKRIFQGVWSACLISVIVSVMMGIMNFLFGADLSALFLVYAPEAVALSYTYLKFIGATLFLLGIMLIFRSTMQGLGKTLSPTLCGIFEMVMSFVTAFFLIPRWGFEGICLANPLAWFASSIPVLIAFLVFAAHSNRKTNK